MLKSSFWLFPLLPMKQQDTHGDSQMWKEEGKASQEGKTSVFKCNRVCSKTQRHAWNGVLPIFSLKSFKAKWKNNFGRINAKLNSLLYDFLHCDSNIFYYSRVSHCSQSPHTCPTKILRRIGKEQNNNNRECLSKPCPSAST